MEKTIQDFCKTILEMDAIKINENTTLNTADLIVDVLDESFDDFVEDLSEDLHEIADILYSELSAMIEEIQGYSIIEEGRVLDIAARRKRAMVMRRYKTKISTARKRANRRRANMDQIGKRATRRARSTLRDRFTGNKKYSDLSPSEKMTIDKRMARIPNSVLQRLSSKMVPKVKQIENERLKTALAKSGVSSTTDKKSAVKPKPTVKTDKSGEVKQVKNTTPKSVVKKIAGKKSIKEGIEELKDSTDINSIFTEAYLVKKEDLPKK